MRPDQCWLATATILSLMRPCEVRHPGAKPADDHQGYLSSHHHHRHRHKQTESPTLLDPTLYMDKSFDYSPHYETPNVFKERSYLDRSVLNYDIVSYDNERKNDWINVSNHQSSLAELKDKKHHQHWPIKREAVIEGDLVLGGLMMVHERSDNLTCGPVMPQGGVQALETMLYTLDIVNNKLKLIPRVTIGAHVLDDCDRDTYGLEMAVDFIKGN